MTIEAKVSGLYLSKLSGATGKDYFAIKNEAEQLRYKFKGEFGSVKREEK